MSRWYCRLFGKLFCRCTPPKRSALKGRRGARARKIVEYASTGTALYAIAELVGCTKTWVADVLRRDRPDLLGYRGRRPYVIGSEEPILRPGGVYSVPACVNRLAFGSVIPVPRGPEEEPKSTEPPPVYIHDFRAEEPDNSPSLPPDVHMSDVVAHPGFEPKDFV